MIPIPDDPSYLLAVNDWLRHLDLANVNQVALSPDLARLVMIRDLPDKTQAGLWVASLHEPFPFLAASYTDVQRLGSTDAELIMVRPRWSADARWLAFTVYQGLPPGKDHQLWVVQPDSASSLRCLYTGKDVIAAHLWSPDGTVLAVADSGAGLVIASLDHPPQALDAEAMRYPLGENHMTWLKGEQKLLYLSVTSDRTELRLLSWPSCQRSSLVTCSPEEVIVPADVPNKTYMMCGALRGGIHQRTLQVTLYLWSNVHDEPRTLLLSDVLFDPVTPFVSNSDGSLWAFTLWAGGARILGVMDQTTGRVQCSPMPAKPRQILGWSATSERLWVLLQEQVVALEPTRQNGVANSIDGFFVLELTTTELLYVLEVLGIQQMLGLPRAAAEMILNPTQREATQASLALHGYIVVQPKGEVYLDRIVAALVQCCATAQQTWISVVQDDGGPREVRYIHQFHDLIVEHALCEPDMHCFTPLRDVAAVQQRLFEQLHLSDQGAISGTSFVLPEEALLRLRDVATTGGQLPVVCYLTRSGVDETTAAAFAQVLTHPLFVGVLANWPSSVEEQKMLSEHGLTILEGPSGLWLLQPFLTEGAWKVSVSPATAVTIRQRISASLSTLASPKSG